MSSPPPVPGTQLRHAAGVVAILGRVRPEGLVRALEVVDAAYQVRNPLSLQHDLRFHSGRLCLWFDCTEKRAVQELSVSTGWDRADYRQEHRVPKPPLPVDLSPSREGTPTPSYGCSPFVFSAQVAHMPGAAQSFNKLEWDAEESGVLAFDVVGSIQSFTPPVQPLKRIAVISGEGTPE